MCVCMYLYIYIYIYIPKRADITRDVWLLLISNTYPNIHTGYLYIYIHLHMYIYIYTYIFIHKREHVTRDVGLLLISNVTCEIDQREKRKRNQSVPSTGGVESQDALSLQVIFHKRAL